MTQRPLTQKQRDRQPPSPAQTAAYIAALVKELGAMAQRAKLKELSALLRMVELQAEEDAGDEGS